DNRSLGPWGPGGEGASGGCLLLQAEEMRLGVGTGMVPAGPQANLPYISRPAIPFGGGPVAAGARSRAEMVCSAQPGRSDGCRSRARRGVEVDGGEKALVLH